MGSARAFSEEEEGLELGPCFALLSNTLCSRKVSPDAGTILLTSNLQSYRQSELQAIRLMGLYGSPSLGYFVTVTENRPRPILAMACG